MGLVREGRRAGACHADRAIGEGFGERCDAGAGVGAGAKAAGQSDGRLIAR